jgi:chromosomal replication initiation ATPase DnaA
MLLKWGMAKRINFNMASECHALLKSFCAIKDISVSEYCYELIAADFAKNVREDPQIRQLLLNGSYPPGSKADKLQKEIKQEFNNE